ncbi:Nn.00g041830.m01.CDS01 [Neocucurbitaria sp. VM-36]
MLDTDVLLGYEDSGEGVSDHSTTIAPQPQRRPGFILQEFGQNIRPSAPTPPSQSFHPSTLMYDGSASATPIQQQPVHQQPPRQQQQQHTFMDTLLARQQSNFAAREETRLSQNSPAATVLGSRSLHTEHSQPQNPSAVPTASVCSSDQDTVSDRIRLHITWDRTLLKVWLDMRSPCETFFRTFQEAVEKRKGLFDRSNIIIFLKKDKLWPDNEAYPLSLNEDDLEADWDETVSFLKENPMLPNVYGRIEVGDG